MILVDSNVLLDIMTRDPVWLEWSAETLDSWASKGPLLINEIVYAELAVKSSSHAELEKDLGILRVKLDRATSEALYLAGKVFGRYRNAGGVRTNVLPDFFIGAHAQVANVPLLTRDMRRYRKYFPDLKLIAPD
jgi:predicted nucleic acid-binding protein